MYICEPTDSSISCGSIQCESPMDPTFSHHVPTIFCGVLVTYTLLTFSIIMSRMLVSLQNEYYEILYGLKHLK